MQLIRTVFVCAILAKSAHARMILFKIADLSTLPAIS